VAALRPTVVRAIGRANGRWLAAGFVAVAVVVGVLIASGGGNTHKPRPEPRGFQTLFYARQGEGAFTEHVLAREQHLEEHEHGPQSVETGLRSVRCLPKPAAPLPSFTLSCEAIVQRKVSYSRAAPFASHSWQGTVRLDHRTGGIAAVSLRRRR
jgi:hypothetical protein